MLLDWVAFFLIDKIGECKSREPTRLTYEIMRLEQLTKTNFLLVIFHLIGVYCCGFYFHRLIEYLFGVEFNYIVIYQGWVVVFLLGPGLLLIGISVIVLGGRWNKVVGIGYSFLFLVWVYWAVYYLKHY